MTEGLHKIANCENPDRVADVVFVHGLDGDAFKTWQARDDANAFWPRWLSEDFPAVGIWSLGYAVSASAWKGHSMPLYDRANHTLDLLDLDHLGQRPLAFICHSLGGLLVKQLLRSARDSTNADWKRITEQTRLIVFLSTPHSGADMASWIQYLGTLLRTTVSVEELEAHHPRLRELNSWYRDHAAELRISTFVYHEKLPTGGILVVDETTADPGIPGVRPIPLDENHVTICKPVSKEAQVYRRVKRLIGERLLNTSASANVGGATGSEEPDRAGQVYTGELLSLDFQDIEVRAVLQILADFTGLNIIVSDTVQGNLALRLQNVPWDQALDEILRLQGLGQRRSGNVIYIAPVEEMVARDRLDFEIQKSREASEPLHTVTIQLSHAQADDIATLIKDLSEPYPEDSLLSPRGQVTAYQHNDILVVRDIDTRIAEIEELIARLDVPQRQARIEAVARQKNTVFISYSHRDQQWLERLQVHLKPLERAGLLRRWDDTMIRPGQDWQQEIDQALRSAQVAVLLISADYLASDFIDRNELPPLLEKHANEGIVVLPLILSPSRFARIPNLAQFQAVNSPDQPLTGLSETEQERILVKVTDMIENTFQTNQSVPVAPSCSSNASATDTIDDNAYSGSVERKRNSNFNQLSVKIAIGAVLLSVATACINFIVNFLFVTQIAVVLFGVIGLISIIRFLARWLCHESLGSSSSELKRYGLAVFFALCFTTTFVVILLAVTYLFSIKVVEKRGETGLWEMWVMAPFQGVDRLSIHLPPVAVDAQCILGPKEANAKQKDWNSQNPQLIISNFYSGQRQGLICPESINITSVGFSSEPYSVHILKSKDWYYYFKYSVIGGFLLWLIAALFLKRAAYSLKGHS